MCGADVSAAQAPVIDKVREVEEHTQSATRADVAAP
jgi:hypothetical protein